MTIMENDGTLPLNYDLYLYHGDTERRKIELENTEEPYDLTGCVVTAQIRVARPVPRVLVPIVVTVDPDQVTNKGDIWFEIEKDSYLSVPRFSETQEFGVWDLQIVWPSGDSITYLEGSVFFKGDVTHG